MARLEGVDDGDNMEECSKRGGEVSVDGYNYAEEESSEADGIKGEEVRGAKVINDGVGQQWGQGGGGNQWRYNAVAIEVQEMEAQGFEEERGQSIGMRILDGAKPSFIRRGWIGQVN